MPKLYDLAHCRAGDKGDTSIRLCDHGSEHLDTRSPSDLGDDAAECVWRSTWLRHDGREHVGAAHDDRGRRLVACLVSMPRMQVLASTVTAPRRGPHRHTSSSTTVVPGIWLRCP